MPFQRSACFMLCLSLAPGCGTRDLAPEGFSAREWASVRNQDPRMAGAHEWINADRHRRELRAKAAEACFRAYAFSHPHPDDLLTDFAARRRYYRTLNSTWLPDLALRARGGEGDFAVLLARALREEEGRCWSPESRRALDQAARAIAPSAP
nr:hypothetical protein [uncultured Holophaga sp.]